jgi:adenine-specific DNA-methyltransferase
MPTLHWIGKEKVINHDLEIPYHTLNREYDFNNSGNKDSGNKIIHADNLLALKSLLPEYEGRIKCIYIDPPYNTGNEGWVYNDNVSSPRFKKWLGQVVGKEGEDLTRHDKWLCMMYPRLKLLHKLLAEDGAIFISIDDNEQANLKMIMDEIFGEGNFLNNIIWQKKFSPQNDAKYFSDNHDFVICYSKNKTNWRRNLLLRTDKQNARYKNIDNDDRGAWTSGDVSVKTYNAATDYPITTPSGRIVNPPSGYCWRFSKEKFQELVEENRIWFGFKGNSVPRFKRFLSDVQQGTVPVTIWMHEDVGHNQSAKQELKRIFDDSLMPFDTPKPPSLIERIVEISADKNSIILDSFAGSGTTAHAVLNLNKQDGGNRKFILIEMEDYAETITAERVRRVIKGYGETEGTDGSFSYYTLGERVLDDEGNLNPELPIEKIYNYIWYSETHQSYTQQATAGYLGKCGNIGFYFHYQPHEATILDDAYLKNVTEPCEQYVMYADVCLLSERTLLRHNIIFKKIPRDISKL